MASAARASAYAPVQGSSGGGSGCGSGGTKLSNGERFTNGMNRSLVAAHRGERGVEVLVRERREGRSDT